MGKVEIVRNATLGDSGPTDENPVLRSKAFQHGDVWAGFSRVAAGRDTGWHHHGENDTYGYFVHGHGRVDSGPGGKDSGELVPGDAAFIPAHTIHREITGSEEFGGFVVRIGRGPLVFPVAGPE